MKKILITGVPGSGKTTIVSEFLNLQKDFDIVNFGDIMIAQKNGMQRDDLRRKISQDQYRKIQLKAAKQIAAMAKEKNLLIDTHLVLSHPYGYTSGMPNQALSQLSPDMVVIIEAKPKDIQKRRAKDQRDRDKETKFQIDLHQQLNRAAAMAIATLTNCSVKIIYSPQGKAKVAAKELQVAIESL